jgi:hypothetical protein
VINGAFQNHLHLIYGLPNGWFYPVTDTSDVLSKPKRRKYKTEEELLEEYLAAQILAGRQAEALAAKQAVEDALIKLDLETQEKAKRVRYLMMFMLMED